MPKKSRTRASNGMGSIRQRGDGRWEARYTTPSGAQKSVYGKTEKEVTAKLRTQLHDIDAGRWREPSRMTIDDWFSLWLTDYQGHTSGRTTITYKGVVDNYIRPVIGPLRLSVLKPVHIMKVLSEMQARNLSPTTQRQTLAVLNNAMNAAIAAGAIKNNPTDGVKRPKRNPKRFQIVDRQQFKDFIAAALDTEFPNELLLMLYTGVRVGELRGLRWGDFTGSKLAVERQLYTHAHGIGFGLPKYGEIRTLELMDEAIDVLKAQRKRQAEQKLAAGDKWYEDDLTADLIFRQKIGKIHTNVSLSRAVKQAGAAIGMPELHPHDLRHSYAVAALRAGADVKTVQHNMGHKSASVTLDTYADYTTDAGKVSAKKLSEYFKNEV